MGTELLPEIPREVEANHLPSLHGSESSFTIDTYTPARLQVGINICGRTLGSQRGSRGAFWLAMWVLGPLSSSTFIETWRHGFGPCRVPTNKVHSPSASPVPCPSRDGISQQGKTRQRFGCLCTPKPDLPGAMADPNDDPLGGFKHCIEYSKSGRAGCKKCKEKIAQVTHTPQLTNTHNTAYKQSVHSSLFARTLQKPARRPVVQQSPSSLTLF